MTKARPVTVPMSLSGLALPAGACSMFSSCLRQLLLPLAPFPALILNGPSLIAFLLGASPAAGPRVAGAPPAGGPGASAWGWLCWCCVAGVVARLVDHWASGSRPPRWLVQGVIAGEMTQSWATPMVCRADFGAISAVSCSPLHPARSQSASVLSLRAPRHLDDQHRWL